MSQRDPLQIPEGFDEQAAFECVIMLMAYVSLVAPPVPHLAPLFIKSTLPEPDAFLIAMNRAARSLLAYLDTDDDIASDGWLRETAKEIVVKFEAEKEGIPTSFARWGLEDYLRQQRKKDDDDG